MDTKPHQKNGIGVQCNAQNFEPILVPFVLELHFLMSSNVFFKLVHLTNHVSSECG